MSKARLLQDYLIPGSAEDENTLIASNWLEFVSARDDREQPPMVRFTESDLRGRVREFQRQMSAVVRANESLREALATDRCEYGIMTPGLAGRLAGFPGGPASVEENDESGDDDGGYESEAPLSPSPLGTLLLKILGK